VIDVFGEVRIRVWVVERLAEEDFVDGFGGRLDVPRASEVLPERLTDEVPKRDSPSAGDGRGTPVEIGRQEKLRPVHV
jgi:hypothetical protein